MTSNEERPVYFPACPAPTSDIAAAPDDATTLFVTGAARNFNRLVACKSLRSLFVREISQAQLDLVAGMDWLEALSIFIFRGPSLASIARLPRLRALAVSAAPKISALTDFAALTRLESLSVGDMKLVRDLGPLAGLRNLRSLAIEGSFTSLQRLESFAPLTALTHVTALSLDGVRVDDDDLRPIARMKQLRWLRIHPPKFPVREHARLSVALPNTECESFQAAMKGPRARKLVDGAFVDDDSVHDVILVGRPMRLLRSADPKAARQIAAREAEFKAWQEWYRSVPDPAEDDTIELAPIGPRRRALR